MQRSESIKNIAKALLLFHSKVDKIKKDSNNPFFKSKYASLSTILESIQVPLQEAGLSFAQFPEDKGLTTILMHGESGEFIESTYTVLGIPEHSKEKNKEGEIIWRSEPYVTPQALGSAITYARRYGISAILGLNIDEDDDGNMASGKKQSSPKETQQPQAPQPDYTELDAKYTQSLKDVDSAETMNAVLAELKAQSLMPRYSQWIQDKAAMLGLLWSETFGSYGEPLAPPEEDIQKAIADLADCNTVKDIKNLISQLPPATWRDKRFKDAAKDRQKAFLTTAQTPAPVAAN